MQLDKIRQLLQQNNLLVSLPPSTINDIAKKFSVVSFSLGEIIIRTGKPCEAFYIIANGKARMVDDTTNVKPITLAILAPGDSFGEQPLLSQGEAETSVRAAENLTLLKLTAEEFQRLVNQFPTFKTHLQEHVQRQTEFKFLRTINIFSSLTLAETQQLSASINTIKLRKNEFLFHEGTPADAAYIIRTGSICLIKESAENTTLGILKVGELFGEIDLLQGLHFAAAVANKDTVIWRLSQTIFTRLTKQPKVGACINQLAKNRALQVQAILNGHRNPSPKEQVTTIKLKKVKLGQGWFSRSVYLAYTETPLLAPIACLAMINRFYHRQIDLQPIIAQQQLQNHSDTLLSLSRKAEAQGYMTRLLHLNDKHLAQVIPAIIQDNSGQLCVIPSVSHTHVTLANPLTGVHQIKRKQFVETWNGQVLSVTYIPNFGSVGKQTRQIFQQFLPIVRPYSNMLIWIGIISIVLQLLGLIGPLFSQIIIDKVLVHGNYSLLYLMLLGMLFVTAFQLVSGALQSFLMAHALKRISVSLILRFFNHILSLPQKIFSKWQVGDFTIRFEENEKLLELVAQSGFKIIIDSLTILVYLVVLLSKNAKLTGVALIFVASYGLVLLVSTPLLRANDRRVFECQKEVESHLIEVVTGIDTVKAIATENLFFEQGVNFITKAQETQFKGALLTFNIGLISNLINQTSTIAILGYGAMLTLQGELSTGELVAFNAMLGLLLTPLQSLVEVWDELQEIRISFERINDVLILPPEHQDLTAVLPNIKGRVRLENVYFRYDGANEDVLCDINLEVMPGEKIAIVGRSGSGKTTLAKLLIKLLEPTLGKIFIDDIDISNIELSSYRRQLAVVEQQPFLFNGTIRDNIAKANPTADLESISAAAKLAGAHEFIDPMPLGYDTQIGERGITLSGGQKQRLIIARALLTNPRILILDEPTASLDSESERLIMENLQQQMAGRTTFIIAHRLSTVRNADRIVVMDKGRIVEIGTHDELYCQRGLYFYLNGTCK